MQSPDFHNNPAPVALFCYNRPGHLERTLHSLAQNTGAEATPLVIFSDGPKNPSDQPPVDAVRHILDGISNQENVRIIKQEHNQGLAKSVILGVSEVIRQFGKCIVIEDDLELSPFFLTFMNQALTKYEDDETVFSVSGYCPPVKIPADFPYEAFRFPRINSWGWGTWLDRWEKVDWDVKNFDSFISDPDQVRKLEQQGKDLPVMLLKQQTGKNNSWAVRFNQACFELGMTNIYPVTSLVRNRGADSSGTHMKLSRKFSVSLASRCPQPQPAGTDTRIHKSFRNFYKPSLYRQTINRMKILRFLNRNKLVPAKNPQ
ncbi:MAG: glycosyltransferase [Bacteroidota bacterium]